MIITVAPCTGVALIRGRGRRQSFTRQVTPGDGEAQPRRDATKRSVVL